MASKSLIAIYIPCLTGGGAEHVMMRLAGGLAKKGYSVDFVVSNATGPDDDKVPANLATMPDGVNFIDFKVQTPKASVKPLVAYLRTKKPVTMLCFSHNANVVALLARLISGTSTRIVLTIHNTYSEELKKATDRRSKFTMACTKLMYGLADQLIAVSKGVADDMCLSFGRPKGWVKVIYNPVVSEELLDKSRKPVSHPFFINSDVPIIVSIGRLHPQKDFKTLLDAFAKVHATRPCRLVIFGEGALRGELQERAKQLQIEDDLSLPGYTDNPYSHLANASLFVLSSLHEGLPTVLIEALACGCPVVSTDCPSGPMEILEGGKRGTLVPMQDVDAMAEAIIKHLSQARVSAPTESWLPYTIENSVAAYVNAIEGKLK